MSNRVIVLNYPAVCADCGIELPAGVEARYYGPGKVYCVKEHSGESKGQPAAKVTRRTQVHCPACGTAIIVSLSTEEVKNP